MHGDFKIDNLMVAADDPTRIIGLLDWEMSTLGDTLTDLGILCSFWDHAGEFHNPITAGATALPGFPTRDELVAAYLSARDIDVDDIDWYLVFADFKIAVILEGIHARHLQGHTEGEDFAGVGAMVDPLLDRALGGRPAPPSPLWRADPSAADIGGFMTATALPAVAPTLPPETDPAALDLRPSDRARELRSELVDFMHTHVFPAEHEYEAYRQAAGPDDHVVPPVVEDLKAEARSRGLWNLFLPAESGIGQLDYAGLAEITGWSLHLAPEATNGQAPDTGNMELLHLFGTDEQKSRWLAPLLEGSIRSAFSMTEVAVASSDATNIETRIDRDGDEYVINGRKWWTSGAADPRCALLIVMGKTDVDAAPHRQQSMVLVPTSTPGSPSRATCRSSVATTSTVTARWCTTTCGCP